MITLSMVEAGYKGFYPIINLINSPNGDGVVCKIGEHWFYFGGLTAEGETPESYISNVPEDEIIREIFTTLDEMRGLTEYADEYAYYEAYFNEHYISGRPHHVVPPRRLILFRGQTRRKGERVRMNGEKLPGNWVYGGIMPGDGDRSIIYGAISGDNEKLTVCTLDKHVVWADTVGEYSGCDDSKKNHIFEHDFLRDQTSGKIYRVCVSGGAFYASSCDDGGLILLDNIAMMCEVIGNESDDPELMASDA